MNKPEEIGFNYTPPRKKTVWPIIIIGLVAIFILKGLLFAHEPQPVAIQPLQQLGKSSSVENSSDKMALTSEEPPPLVNATSDIVHASKDEFANLVDETLVKAKQAADNVALFDPVKFQTDIVALQKDEFLGEASPYVKSEAFEILNGSYLTLRDSAEILAKTYLIKNFLIEKDGDYLNIGAPKGRLFYNQQDVEYRLIPKLNFQIGNSYYLVFDHLKRDGEYSDCHACQVPISVVNYHNEGGAVVVDQLYEGIANLGAWGNSGLIRFVKFSNGEFGFIVTDSTMNQGYVSNWINAFKVKTDAIIEVPELKNGSIIPPTDPIADVSNNPSLTTENVLNPSSNDEEPLEASLLTEKAESGDADAEFSLGLLYDLGEKGVTQDYSEAAKWYSKSASQGHAKAQHNLGVLYHDGQGLPKSYEQSYFWMLLAAKSGDEGSARLRDQVERKLTAAQVADVQKKAANWRPTVGYNTAQKPYRASFECSKARSLIEITICSDAELSGLDLQMGKAFSEALKLLPENKRTIREDQRKFLQSRLLICPVLNGSVITETQVKALVECLKPQYLERIDILQKKIFPNTYTQSAKGPKPKPFNE